MDSFSTCACHQAPAMDLQTAIESDDWANAFGKCLLALLTSGYPLICRSPCGAKGQPGSLCGRGDAVSPRLYRSLTALHERTVRGVLVLDDLLSIGGFKSEALLGDLPSS